MFEVRKRLEVSAAHMLRLPYESKCQNLHGHNWHIEIRCQSETLNAAGMVYDFTQLKREIHGKLDHQFLNEILEVNPTAENIAFWIASQIGDLCVEVRVEESDGNLAIWRR